MEYFLKQRYLSTTPFHLIEIAQIIIKSSITYRQPQTMFQSPSQEEQCRTLPIHVRWNILLILK